MRRLLKMGWLSMGLLAIQLASGQTPGTPSLKPPQEDLRRAVELMVRLKFDLPTACTIDIQSRTPSQFSGYDSLRVVISQAGRSTDIDFLISKDNTSLVRLESFDLGHNPALAIDTQNRPIRGNPSAPVTVINFDDLECPVCARMHEILKTELTQKYGNKVRLIYKDNPLTEIHPWAMHAAVDAGCLAQQDPAAYWNFVDYVHTHGQEISGEDRNLNRSFVVLDRLATQSAQEHKVDQPVLLACLKLQEETPVRQSMKEARDLGLNFTPALIVNGELVRGLTSIKDPELAIDRALQSANSN